MTLYKDLENNKIKALIEMKNALLSLKNAWLKCEYSFSNIYIDCNDYIVGDGEEAYPFSLSFEELNTIGWIDGAIRKIVKDITDLIE